MDRTELENYLYDHIPLTKAMGVTVTEASGERIVLAAPLGPNVNHRHTAFGGSIGALATLAAWSWLHVDGASLEFAIRLVVRSNRVEYLHPIQGDFTALCGAPGDLEYERYRDALHRKGKARIELGSTVEHDGQIAATFAGTFVAVRHDGP